MESFDKHIKILESKCEEWGITLKKNARSYYFDHDEREIGIPLHTKNKKSIICGLLHEMGHAIQDNHPFEEIYKSPVVNRFIIISLEYEAWKIGLDILEETGLAEYRKYYIKAWVKSWNKYIDYTADYPADALKFLSRSISPR
jgi:hypothetical protein